MTTSTGRPALGALHHLAITVSDVETSATWYERVLGLQRPPAPFPHNGDESPPLSCSSSNRLDGHRSVSSRAAPQGRRGREPHGHDHVGLSVPNRQDLDEWSAHLDAVGVRHCGVTDRADPNPYSALVFRDPDNIQLELVHLPG